MLISCVFGLFICLLASWLFFPKILFNLDPLTQRCPPGGLMTILVWVTHARPPEFLSLNSTPTYPAVRLSDSSDISFWKAWGALKPNRFETEFRILLPKLVLLKRSSYQWIFPPSTLSLPQSPYSSHCRDLSTSPVIGLWNLFFFSSSLPWL